MNRIWKIHRVELTIEAKCPTIPETDQQHDWTFSETVHVVNAKDGEAAVDAAKAAVLERPFEHPDLCAEFFPVRARVRTLALATENIHTMTGTFMVEARGDRRA